MVLFLLIELNTNIMKKWFLGACLFLLSQMAFAQAWTGFNDQKVQIGLHGWGHGTGLVATYDHGVSDLISLGGGANFFFDEPDGDNFFIFGRVNFHLQHALGLREKWDIYPGANIGVLGNTFELGVHLGVRHFFNEKIGAFIEAGNHGSIGVTINL